MIKRVKEWGGEEEEESQKADSRFTLVLGILLGSSPHAVDPFSRSHTMRYPCLKRWDETALV